MKPEEELMGAVEVDVGISDQLILAEGMVLAVWIIERQISRGKIGAIINQRAVAGGDGLIDQNPRLAFGFLQLLIKTVELRLRLRLAQRPAGGDQDAGDGDEKSDHFSPLEIALRRALRVKVVATQNFRQ